jgi:hypothetical protein
LAQLHALQRLVQARGWELHSPDDDADEHGLVTTFEAMWEYPAAYGGAEIGVDEETAPYLPACGFTVDPEETAAIRVETAGNWGGCDDRSQTRSLPATDAGLARLPALLAEVEAHARTMDPLVLIECTSSGPCGRNAEQRDQERQARMDWAGSMVRAYEERMTDQQRAELHAWEKANLDGHRVGTSDWPGWIPLIGAPCWRDRSSTE